MLFDTTSYPAGTVRPDLSYNSIRLNKITNPSMTALLADSYNAGTNSQYPCICPHSNVYGVYSMIHSNRANTLYTDGHVDAADKTKLLSISDNSGVPYQAVYVYYNKTVQNIR
jgi:prepilin-type processing-associated H-X9-DG protein